MGSATATSASSDWPAGRSARVRRMAIRPRAGLAVGVPIRGGGRRSRRASKRSVGASDRRTGTSQMRPTIHCPRMARMTRKPGIQTTNNGTSHSRPPSSMPERLKTDALFESLIWLEGVSPSGQA